MTSSEVGGRLKSGCGCSPVLCSRSRRPIRFTGSLKGSENPGDHTCLGARGDRDCPRFGSLGDQTHFARPADWSDVVIYACDPDMAGIHFYPVDDTPHASAT